MKTSVHIAASAALAAMVYPFFQWKVPLIFVGGVLIDVDHYLWYVYKYKKLSLLGCYRHYMKHMGDSHQEKDFGTLLIFHTAEFLLLMAVLSFYSEYFLVFTIGLFGHYLLDLAYLYSVPKKFIVNHSVIYWLCMGKFANFK